MMRRNIFGDPTPSTATEIVEALDEIDLMAVHAQAEIFEPIEAEKPPFDGWCAEISDCDTGDKRISTVGFPTRALLEEALCSAGIFLIMEA